MTLAFHSFSLLLFFLKTLPPSLIITIHHPIPSHLHHPSSSIYLSPSSPIISHHHLLLLHIITQRPSHIFQVPAVLELRVLRSLGTFLLLCMYTVYLFFLHAHTPTHTLTMPPLLPNLHLVRVCALTFIHEVFIFVLYSMYVLYSTVLQYAV